MPKQITGIKDFIEKTKRKDAKSIVIKKNKENTKFRVRTAKTLYTLVISDPFKAEMIKKSLPENIEVSEK